MNELDWTSLIGLGGLGIVLVTQFVTLQVSREDLKHRSLEAGNDRLFPKRVDVYSDLIISFREVYQLIDKLYEKRDEEEKSKIRGDIWSKFDVLEPALKRALFLSSSEHLRIKLGVIFLC